MFRLGLCSVTFRDKSVEEVIGIAAANSLDGIEWGGDVHVPPDTPPQRVREIAGLCSDAGIDIPTYGSYFNVLDDSAGDFAPLLETAHALGAGAIRVWAGWVEPGQETAEQWEKITSTSREIAGAAAEKNIRVAYEFHDHTPTEGGENAMRLLEAVGHANMFTYWQTVYPNTLEGSLDNLEKVYPKLIHIHVQNNDGENVLAMADFPDLWREVLRRLIERNFDGYGFFEFNQDNSPEQLAEDVKFIRKFMAEV